LPDNDLLSFLKKDMELLPHCGTVSVLPDFFMDRFVKLESIDELIAAIKIKSQEGGGGSLRGIQQVEVKGGNAVNVACALGKLGANVNLLAIAESFYADLLRATCLAFPNIHLETVSGKNGFTVAFEFFENGIPVNVMASDTGDLAEFDGSSIQEDLLGFISSAKIVSVLNWASNRRGTELCFSVYSSAKNQGGMTFFDPADVAELSQNIPDLKKRIFDQCLLDYFSLNDNELRIFCRILSNYILPQNYSLAELEKGARLLSETTNTRVDLHTRKVSISCRSNECLAEPCYKVEQKLITGAGDIWDAADIVGYLLGWEPEKRLKFANATAGFYVSCKEPEPPGLDQVFNFISSKREFYH
jgi:ribokinase